MDNPLCNCPDPKNCEQVAGHGPSVAEIKAHADNINMLFAWAAENGIIFPKHIEGAMRGRFDVKVKPHGTLDLYAMASEAKTDIMLKKALMNLALGGDGNCLDATNTLLLIAFVRGNIEANCPDAPD